MDSETPVSAPPGPPLSGQPPEVLGDPSTTVTPPKPAALPKRFHGSVTLDPARVGRDAGKIAEEVIADLSGLVGAEVRETDALQGLLKGLREVRGERRQRPRPGSSISPAECAAYPTTPRFFRLAIGPPGSGR